MIAAIYARKSTAQHDVDDDARSVTRQVENAREFARTKGWIVLDEHIYIDDGISGVGRVCESHRGTLEIGGAARTLNRAWRFCTEAYRVLLRKLPLSADGSAAG